MMDTMFRKGALPVLERAMAFGEQRHKHIVQNIANIETPFYKGRDLDPDAFARLVKQNIARRDQKVVRTMDFRGDSHHWDDSAHTFQVHWRHMDGQDLLRHDENNLSIEREIAKLSKNSGSLRASINLYKKQMTLIEDTIRQAR